MLAKARDTGECDRRRNLKTNIEIRKFHRPGSQIKAMAHIYRNAYRDYPEYADTLGRDIFGYLESFWEESSPEVLIAVSKGEMLGFIIVDRCRQVHKGEPCGEVHEFAINYAHRGRRIGSTLLTTGIDYLESSGLRKINLWVGNQNKPALSLYQKHGFQKTFSEKKWTKMERSGQSNGRDPGPWILAKQNFNPANSLNEKIAL